ncbi:Pleckstrin homology domain-containing protein [Jimgerdemannia flammicorona]|uniref:Pleckstrin homology domain-containing protein n=1 Tax=Jimgerdemannia flammicorona TaxID=994334 RepID=A0A433PN90_9FUNG|nr:Pleckstrin homology domain-containing protein [Jimgerdemannia flammicorona]
MCMPQSRGASVHGNLNVRWWNDSLDYIYPRQYGEIAILAMNLVIELFALPSHIHRKLCQKLYFKAEAQQIDRILEVFANRYFECNPKSLYGSADVVYAVVYSVLLLNTDLHVAQGNYTKMSRLAFIKNTMNVLRDQPDPFVDPLAPEYDQPAPQPAAPKPDKPEQSKEWELEMEAMLKEIYVSVKTHQILQPLSGTSEGRTSSQGQRSTSPQPPASPTNSTGLTRSRSLLSTGRVIKRGVNAAMRKGTKDVVIQEGEPEKPRTSTSTPRPAPVRRDSNSSVASATSMASNTGTIASNHGGTYRAVSPTHNSHISAVFVSSAPFFKEGLVVRKHLLERADQKAKHRDWRECFLVVDRGELKMYRLEGGGNDQGRKSMMSRHSTASLTNLSDSGVGSSASSAGGGGSGGGGFNGATVQSSGQLIGDVNLRHTLANALPPPGYNRQRPHVFALQQPDGGVYLFQANSQAQVIEWVSTCNYWAARESKEPLAGGVSNMEYGWGACLNPPQVSGATWPDPDSIVIFEWKPPLPPMVSSPLDEMAQLTMLRRHTDDLNKEMDDHKEHKRKIEARFPRSTNQMKAVTNWENKSQYLLHEIIKYQNYCDAIEKALVLRERADLAEEESEGGKGAVAGDSVGGSGTGGRNTPVDGLLPKMPFGEGNKGSQRATWAGPDF